MKSPRTYYALALYVIAAALAACSSQSTTPNIAPAPSKNTAHSTHTMSNPPHKPATSGYSLFGDASLVSPGSNSPTAAQATSSESSGYGGVDFSVPAG